MLPILQIRSLGRRDYESVWTAMRGLTDERTPESADELWLLEHFPVFTQGQSGKPEHVLNPGNIPIVQTDRGGQVTYHGPGQLVVYTLIDIHRLQISTRQYVNRLEQAIVQLLAHYGIQAESRQDAPGVYVDGAKICSIGLRVRQGRSYHGIAFNVDMDLTPFSFINPCGYKGLRMAQLRDFCPNIDKVALEQKMIHYLAAQFGYNEIRYLAGEEKHESDIEL